MGYVEQITISFGFWNTLLSSEMTYNPKRRLLSFFLRRCLDGAQAHPWVIGLIYRVFGIVQPVR